MRLSHPSFRLRVALSIAALSLIAGSAAAQTSASPATKSAESAAQPLSPFAPFQGRSWDEYFRATAAAKARHSASREVKMTHALTSGTRFHHDAGSLGNQTAAPYFSGPDTAMGVDPSGYDVYAAARLQYDCTLNEDILVYNSSISPPYQLSQSIPGFEKYLHNISGLSPSTLDKFPNGCDDPTIYGQTYINVAAGKTYNSNYVGAGVLYTINNEVATAVYTPTWTLVSSAHYPVGTGTATLLSADFNGDGYSDLAVTYAPYSGNQYITILLANGDGTFKTPVNIPSDFQTLGIVAGDFNGDHKVDIVATAQKSSGDYELLFFQGNGDGTFKPFTSVDTGTTERLVSLPVDINKDGKLDIMAWDFVPNTRGPYTLDALLNNGSASFTPTLSYSNPDGFFPVASGDLNGDGKLDLVYTEVATSSVTVLQGNGAGSFSFKATYPTVYYPNSAYIADYDGDGNNDIVVGYGGEVGAGPTAQGAGEFLLGNGDFTFSSPPNLQPLATGVNFGTGPQSFAVADLNGDSKQDVAVVGSTTAAKPTISVSTFLNNGKALANGSAVNFTVAPQPSYYTAPPGYVLAAPLSGTTPNDLVVAGTDPTTSAAAIQTAINNGSGSFTVKSTLLDLAAPVVSFVAADFNADSKGDLALILNDGQSSSADALYLARGNGDGTFQPPTILDAAINDGGQLFIADVNGDGKPDLVAIQNTLGYSYLRTYLNQGSTFAAPNAFALPDGAGISGIIPTDFNGDGKLDLIVVGALGAGYPTSLYLYTGNKTGAFTYFSTIPIGYYYAQTGIMADVNHDGIPDIVLDGCCEEGAATILLGQGNGVFGIPQPIFPINASGVQAINLNGDAYPDLIFGMNNSVYGVNYGAVAPLINHYANAPSTSKAATTVTLTNPPSEKIAQGNDIQLVVKVAESTTPEIPTGNVTLSYGSTVISSAQVGDTGILYMDLDTTPFPPGTYTLTLAYSGDNWNLPSSTTFSVTVEYATTLKLTITPNPVPYNGSVTLTATAVRTPGSGAPTGSVNFLYNNGEGVIAENLKLVNGSVSYTASAKGLPSGLYQVQAFYGGDTTDAGSISATIPVTLVPNGLSGSATAVTFSPNPVTQGQTVSIQAAVTKLSGGTATGTVKFYADYQLIATASLNSSGVATIAASTAYYYTNIYNVYATYSGDSSTYKSTSNTVSFYLRSGTSTQLSVAPATITPGQAITLSAFVEPTSGGSATGPVKFYADGILLGSATLNPNSVTSFTANSSNAPNGAYNVTAVYGGDQYNGGSTSRPVSVTVK